MLVAVESLIIWALVFM